MIRQNCYLLDGSTGAAPSTTSQAERHSDAINWCSRLWDRNIKTTTNIRTVTVKYTKINENLKYKHKLMQTNQRRLV